LPGALNVVECFKVGHSQGLNPFMPAKSYTILCERALLYKKAKLKSERGKNNG